MKRFVVVSVPKEHVEIKYADVDEMVQRYRERYVESLKNDFLSQLKPRYKAKKDRPEKALIGRLSLHARRIELSHPVTGAPIAVEAPLPKDFQLALRNLRKFKALAERRMPPSPEDVPGRKIPEEDP